MTGKSSNTRVKKKISIKKWALIFIISLAAVTVLSVAQFVRDTPGMIEYTEFVGDIQNKSSDTIYIDKSASTIRYNMLNEDNKDMSVKEREEYKGKKEWKRTYYPNYIVYLGCLVPVIAICAMVYLAYLRDEMRIINNKNKDMLEEISSDIKMEDIIGHEEAIEEIKSIYEIIKNKDNKFGARVPKGLMLIGPPGTGKTMVAKALANEIDTKFFYVNSSAIIEMFAGLGAKKIRDIFDEARKNIPCIVFIDEIDAIGKSRASREHKTSEDNQTIDALLQELDGFKDTNGILFLAASNRYEDLDPALVRSGRFDRKITLNPPRNLETRLKLFKLYAGELEVSDEDLSLLARQTSGMTGADIDKIVNEAKLIATIRNKDKVELECLEEALDKIVKEAEQII